MNNNFYDAIGDAEVSITPHMLDFTEKFAPIDDAAKGFKIVMDIVSLGFALSTAPVWNSGK